MLKNRYRPGSQLTACVLLMAIVVMLLSVPVYGVQDEEPAGAITLDGLFEDWQGMPEMQDQAGDGEPWQDIVNIKWFPDINTSNLYLYAERLDGLIDKKNNSKAVDWSFQVDFDFSGSKRIAFVEYHPESELVDVNLMDAEGSLIWSGKGKWGEDKYTANRVEFYVPLSHITGDIQSGYQFEMSFLSQSDRAPDTGFVTVSTAGTFPWLTAVLMLLWLLVLVFFHRQGLHFFRFITGSIGLFVFTMVFGSAIGEKYLESAVTWCLWLISQMAGGFSVFPGYSLVTVYHDLQAVSFIIDYECSGFIELLVFISLLLFYPVFNKWKKVLYGVMGVLFIFAANLVRLLFISFSIKAFGTQVFFLSHTVFARVLFFVLMILLYYYVFTRPHIMKQRVGDLTYD